MASIDFKEIPTSSKGPHRDDFELFCQEYFEALNCTVTERPARGPDGGKDLLVTEHRSGPLTSTVTKWLVSCKHYVHSGKAVGVADEPDIDVRVKQAEADGFIGFYSTLPSASLAERLNKLGHPDPMNRETIESKLLSNQRLESVFSRFFPESYAKAMSSRPVLVFGEHAPLNCVVCGKDLAHEIGDSIYVELKDTEKETIVDCYVVCKRDCDRQAKSLHPGCRDRWSELSDWTIPSEFMRKLMAALNRLRSGDDVYTDDAFVQFKYILLGLSQRVLRPATAAEIRRVEQLDALPPFLR